MRPSPEELNKKIWYRIFKVVVVLVLVGAFVAPWIMQEPNPFLFIDGTVGALMWMILFFISRAVILYIIYGKKERMPEERKNTKEWMIWGTASFILVAGVIAALVFIVF